jgi:hypothetical protein
LARLDRKRKKRTSNKEWKSPIDEDARVAKMKDGRTHLAHKAEHAVDLDSGAVVVVTLQAADKGDTATMDETLIEAGMAMAELAGMRRCHLRGRENILKRQLAHVSAFNLSLVMRQLLGVGTPRELKNRAIRLF